MRQGPSGKFARDFGGASAIRLAGGALLFASQVLLAAWLGPEAFGVYSFAWTWIALLAAVGAFGFAATSVRFIAAYRATRDDARLRGLLRFSRTATLLVSIAATVVAFGAGALLARGSPYWPALAVALLAVPALALLQVEAAFARGFGWVRLSTVAEQIARPLLLMAVGAAIVLEPAWRTAPVLAAVCAGAYFVALAAQHAVLRGRIARLLPAGEALLDRAAWLPMSTSMFVVNGTQMLRTNADLLLVGLLLGPAELGVYTAATRTATLVSFMLPIANMVVQPDLSAAHAVGRRDEVARVFATARRLTFLLSLAAGCGLAFAGPTILALFGPGFAAAYTPMLVMLAGHVAAASFGPLVSLLIMTGRARLVAAVQAAVTAAAAVLAILLIDRFGTLGAAIATAAAALASQLALLVVARPARAWAARVRSMRQP